MLELELIKILAQPGKLLGFAGVSAGLGGNHGVVQSLQVSVEQTAALPLTGLALQQHGFGELLADFHNGVQAGHGVLEDHSNLVAANLVESLLIDFQQILAIIDNLAGFRNGVARLDTQDSPGGHGLTGAGLTHDGQGLALGQVKIDVADCVYHTVGGTEGNPQVFYRQLILH